MMYNYGGYYQCNSGFATTKNYNILDREYWRKSLFQRMRALFTFTGLPEGGENQVQTDYDAFLYCLFALGYVCVFKSRTYGVVFQPATPSGYGLQYQPTGMIVSTPYFQFDRPLKIGSECELIKLTPDYSGCWDIVERAAEELMYNDVAIRLASINARFCYAIAASDDKTARTVKVILEKLMNGEPAIVFDSKLSKSALSGDNELPWTQFDRDLKKNFILPELLEARRTILTDFYRELGVQSANDKKERVNVADSLAFQAETFNRRQVFELSLQQSIDRVNRMFDLDIGFKYNEMEVSENGISERPVERA